VTDAPKIRARARRRHQTEAERRMWRLLRGRRLGDFKFVRQEPIAVYFADFVRREQKLVVETDGATHPSDDELRQDARRSE
jgi:very-short-patch-repair endonuclease